MAHSSGPLSSTGTLGSNRILSSFETVSQSMNDSTLWEELNSARIFITGGTGFLGTWLLSGLLYFKKHYQYQPKVVVLSRNPNQFIERQKALTTNLDIEWVQGDVRDFHINDTNFTHIIHGASTAEVSVLVKQPKDVLEAAQIGTENILNLKSEKLLYISSGAVYGKQPQDRPFISETDPVCPDPIGPGRVYAESKRLSESLCRQDSKARMARVFALSGPLLPLDRQFALGNFVRDGLAHRAIRVLGDGTAVRTYQHAADTAYWLWSILVRAPKGAFYNVGSQDEAITIRDLAYKVGSFFQLPVEIGNSNQAVPSFNRYVPSVQKIQKELGLKNVFGLDQSIQDLIQSHRA